MKNRDENNFPSNYDLRIPVEETHQRKARGGPVDAMSDHEDQFENALSGIDNMDVREPMNGARNIAQKRTTGGPQV